MILVTRKLIIEVLFNGFIDYERQICMFNKIEFNVFYAIMKGVPIIKILNDLSIRHLIKLILY